MLRISIQRFLAFFLILFAQQALAVRDYVVERAYFEDKSAQMSFEEVKNQQHEPMGAMLSKGYSKSAFWIRLKIDGVSKEVGAFNGKFEDKLILRIQPTYLDEIKLYDPMEPNLGERIVGDQSPWADREYVSLNFNFLIPRSEQARYVWLRLKTTSTSLMQAQALNYEDCSHLDRMQEFGFSFYLAILFILFIFPLWIWLKQREKLTGYFVLKQFGAITLLIFNAGYLRVLFKEIDLNILQFTVNLNLFAYSFITILFHYIFLNEYALKRWTKVFFISLMMTFPIEVILLILRLDSHALHLNMMTLNVMAFGFLVVPAFGIYWRRSEDRVFSKNLLIAIHVLIFAVAILTTIPSLGYLQGYSFSPVSGLAYGGITGIIFIFILQYRFRVGREKFIARVSSAEAYAHAEKERREQQSKFLSMLTHELKTPLSVLKMGYSSAENGGKFKKHIESAITDMTDVIDRCVMDEKLQNQGFSLNLQECDLGQLIQEKVDQYGQGSRIQLDMQQSLLIKTDVQLLKICISNLIDNALKYGNENSLIKIEAKSDVRSSKRVMISVENTLGASGKPDVEKIFEKYYRDPKAYEKTGSGLGLYLVKNFVELLSGTITCLVRNNSIVFMINLPK